MSQQHTTQASGQGMLERVFKLREHGTTARTEVIAGSANSWRGWHGYQRCLCYHLPYCCIW